ncbi:ABC transporter substrate-binding protein [Streptomyces sp. NPDC055140]
MRTQPRSRRALAAALGALTLLLGLVACGSGTFGGSGTSGSSRKIVLISDLSGAFSSVSAPGAAAAEMAVQNINAHGGVNGRKLDLEVIDSQSSPGSALTAAHKAVSQSPLAVVMLSGAAGASSISQLVQSAQIPLLSPALPDSALYPAQPYLYQTSLTARQNADAIYRYAKERLHGSLAGKSVAVAAVNSPYVDTIIKRAEALVARAGGRIGKVERYDVPLASFTTQAGAIARSKPDLVLTLGSTDDSVVTAKALTAAGVTVPQLGIPSGAGQPTLKQIASPQYHALTANPYPSTLPGFLTLAEKHGAQTKVSGSIFSMSGWVSVYALAQAMKKCGSDCTSTTLDSALEHVRNYTVPQGASYGPVTFSASTHIAIRTVRFHTYDPAEGRFSQSAPITLP